MAKFRADAAYLTFMLRVGGFVLLWIAAYCIFSPIAAAAGMMDQVMDTFACVPFVGPVIDGIGDAIEGVGQCITCGLACACAVPCGLIVMSFMWIAMRPLFAIPVLLGLCSLPVLGIYLKKEGQKKGPSRSRTRRQTTRDSRAMKSSPPAAVGAPAEGGDGPGWTGPCGHENPASAKFCMGCGTEKPKPGRNTEAAADGGWTGPCGTPNPASAKFCTGCGTAKPAATAESDDTWTGPCGTKNAATAKFCTGCGTKKP
jgi:hypothetical protein